mgnify:CR=1 FL=1
MTGGRDSGARGHGAHPMTFKTDASNADANARAMPADAAEPAVRCPPPSLVRAGRLGLSLREETEHDGGFTVKLYASTRAEELAPVPWSDAEKAAFLAFQHDAQHTHYRRHYPDAGWFIVESEGKAVGRLYLERWTREVRIIDIALLPIARGRGYGTALLKDVIDEASAAGKTVSIHVEKMNPAMSLYRRLGFRDVEDKGVYLLMQRDPEGAG